jgi:hypothetical protein
MTTRSIASACTRSAASGAFLTGVFAVEQYGGTAGLIEGNAMPGRQPGHRRRHRRRLRRRRILHHPQDHRCWSSGCASMKIERDGLDITLHGESVQ